MFLIEREASLQKIFSRINASRSQSISITGDLKIGKTVLLQQILNKQIQEKYIDHSKNFCFFYKNLKLHQSDYLDLIREIIVSFSPDIEKEKLVGDNVYNSLTEIISDKHQDKTFIVILDNFISSVCPLQEMCVNPLVRESPFFNIFTNIELKTFTNEEGEKLVSIYQGNLVYEIIRNLSGLHPYLMQQIISIMMDEEKSQNLENVKRKLIEENRNFVHELFSSYPEQYPQLLINLANGIKPTEREQYMVNKLNQKGYVNSDYSFTSALLQSALTDVNQEGKKDGVIKKLLNWLQFK
jgi:AAA+ ATPase superfamily predicted ATPase